MSEGRKFHSWQGQDLSPEYDFTEPTSDVHVIWEEVEVGGRAWKGESDIGTIPLRDERGVTGNELNLPAGLTRVSLAAHNRWRWSERNGSNTVARGWIGPKDYMRDLAGGLRADRYREVRMSVLDANEQLKGIIVDANRGAESDTTRVEWVRDTYLNGSPDPTRVITATYVAAGSNTVTLPAQRVYGDPRGVLAEIAAFANKEVFVTSDEELFYDGWDSTAYAAGLRISDRINEITVGESSEPASSVRLYPSTIHSGSGAGESAAAPSLTFTSADAAWEDFGDFDYLYMYDTPVGTSDGSVPASSWAVVNGAVQDVGLIAYMHLLDGDLLSIIQNGGVVRGQQRTKSRHGIGINEDAQLNYSDFCVRVYRPGSGFIANLAEVGEATGTVRWNPSTNGGNRSFGPFTFDAYPSAVAGDYLAVEVGCHHLAPTSGGTGAGVFITDNSGSDLPIADVTTGDNFNSWWQFGPPEEALPTFPPIWDVGPAATEDGQQLLSGLRMYYGAGSNTYVYVNNATTANQYGHYEESMYAPENITTAAQATTLALAVLARRNTEDRNINVSIGPLTENEMPLVKYGQLISIKARAIAFADDQYFSGRIRQLRWTTPVPGMFFAHMMIERPMKEVPYGVGNRAGSEAVSAHVLQGSNAHPEFVLRATLTTQGDLPYRGASDWTRLAIGASNTWLKSIGTVPVWATLPSSAGTIAVEEDGSEEGSAIDRLNFTTGLDVSVSGSEATISATGGAGGSPVYDIERRTAGDISVNSTTAGNALGTIGDVVVAAAAGDLVMVGLSVRTTDSDVGSVRFNAKCITGSTENFVSSLGTTAASTGINLWFRASAVPHGQGGEVPYVVQAADISGGNLTLRLCCWVSGGTHDIAAQTAAPLLFWVRNLGQ